MSLMEKDRTADPALDIFFTAAARIFTKFFFPDLAFLSLLFALAEQLKLIFFLSECVNAKQ